MRSMTGFGNAAITENGRKVTVEIRSVNNKYLDLSIRLPREYAGFEARVRELIRKQVSRGKITVNISMEEILTVDSEIQVDLVNIRKRFKILNQIKNELNFPETITLKHLLSFPDITQSITPEVDEESIWQSVSRATEAAIASFNAMRETEGSNLSRDLVERSQMIASLTQTVEGRGKLNIRQEFDRLYQNVLALIGEQKLDRNRLEQEVAIISDRVDITEECVRMESHLDLLRKTLSSSDDAGKKITFILQEMLREANTMNSKATDIEISHAVIQIKEEIERLREQVQNIE
jgi:uncharacterized protein (TIGR00255 family)